MAQHAIKVHVAMGIADPGRLVFALTEGSEGDHQEYPQKAIH
jgi:hypothetical protein